MHKKNPWGVGNKERVLNRLSSAILARIFVHTEGLRLRGLYWYPKSGRYCTTHRVEGEDFSCHYQFRLTWVDLFLLQKLFEISLQHISCPSENQITRCTTHVIKYVLFKLSSLSFVHQNFFPNFIYRNMQLRLEFQANICKLKKVSFQFQPQSCAGKKRIYCIEVGWVFNRRGF